MVAKAPQTEARIDRSMERYGALSAGNVQPAFKNDVVQENEWLRGGRRGCRTMCSPDIVQPVVVAVQGTHILHQPQPYPVRSHHRSLKHTNAVPQTYSDSDQSRMLG